MIAIIDYGAGNLQSVANTLEELGFDEYAVVRDPDDICVASKLILPGVGHFGQMMRELERLRLGQALSARIHEGIPFLGICLGLQALFDGSEEAPETPGLGLFEGTVKRFPEDARVPHMGWNELEQRLPSRLLADVGPHPYLYFAHSYYVPVTRYSAAICNYVVPYTAVLERGSVFGVQFHPEKSGPLGLQIMKNFAEL